MKRALLFFLLSYPAWPITCTVTVIQGTDTVAASRTVINDNFACLSTNDIPVSRLAGGVNANAGTFWRGDNTWAAVSTGNASQLQGRNISSVAPTQGQALTWNAGTSLWEPGGGTGVTSALGTPNQIAVSAATGAVSFSLVNNTVLPGAPTIFSFLNAPHTHADAANGAQLDNTAVKSANKQGSTGTKFAMALGAFTNGNCRSTDSNGNEVDAGAPCGSGSSAHIYTSGDSTGVGPVTFVPTHTLDVFDFGGAGNTSLTVKAGASQVSPLLNVTDNSNTTLFKVAADGSIVYGNGTLAGAAKFVSGALFPVTGGSASDCVKKDGSVGACGTSANATSFQGVPIEATSPTAGQGFFYDVGSASYKLSVPAGGGATNFESLTDCQGVRTSATRLTFNAAASSTIPCNISVGGIVTSFSGSATVDLNGGTGSVKIYIKYTSTPILEVAYTGITAPTCSGMSCNVVASSTYPADGLYRPLDEWLVTVANTWDSTGIPKRAVQTNFGVTGGSGIGITVGGNGLQAVAVDATVMRTDQPFVVEGTNARMGVATLSSGSATVSTTAVASNSRIFLTPQDCSASIAGLRQSARTPGTSFAISSDGASSCSVAWVILSPQ